MIKSIAIVGVLVAGLMLGACGAKVGHDFDLAGADNYTPGVTTMDQAMGQFGTPETVMHEENGDTRVSWAYGAAGPGGVVGKRLTLVFDRDHKFKRIEKRAQRSGRSG